VNSGWEFVPRALIVLFDLTLFGWTLRRRQRLRSFSLVCFGFSLARAREDMLAAIRTAGYSVVA
jgi:hypothetical protein